jgi:GNAT superfamily N-acetyltransferase
MEIRPMREADVEPLTELVFVVGEDLDRRRGEPIDPRPDMELAHRRYRHPLQTDPEGCWVAEDEQGLAACALSFRRDDIWILSELSVRPDAQSQGLGRAILERCHGYADGAKGRLIATSQDPRALRAYARLGLDAHPCFKAIGTPKDVETPAPVRQGDASDIPFTEEIDRQVRGATHAPDIQLLLDTGLHLLVSDRGYAIHDQSDTRLLAATDEDAARDLLKAVFAQITGEVTVRWLTGRQQWAIETCLEAGLHLSTKSGALFVGGDVGPFHPYLPSGVYL